MRYINKLFTNYIKVSISGNLYPFFEQNNLNLDKALLYVCNVVGAQMAMNLEWDFSDQPCSHSLSFHKPSKHIPAVPHFSKVLVLLECEGKFMDFLVNGKDS